MRPLILLLLAVLALPALEIDIDQGSRWYDLGTSHHLQHGVAGVPFGAGGFLIARTAGVGRFGSYAAAGGSGAAANIVWELREEQAGRAAFLDLVDVGWGAVGGLTGGLLADAGLTGVQLLVRRDAVALAWEGRF